MPHPSVSLWPRSAGAALYCGNAKRDGDGVAYPVVRSLLHSPLRCPILTPQAEHGAQVIRPHQGKDNVALSVWPISVTYASLSTGTVLEAYGTRPGQGRSVRSTHTTLPAANIALTSRRCHGARRRHFGEQERRAAVTIVTTHGDGIGSGTHTTLSTTERTTPSG
jgi:hypothetical protein